MPALAAIPVGSGDGGFLLPTHVRPVMIVLPGYGPSSESTPTAMVDGNAAAAPWKALEGIADGINQVGKVAGGIASEMQDVENAADVTNARLKLSESRAQFEQSLLEDHDYKNYATRAENELFANARNLVTDDMAPVVRERLEREIAQWTSDTRIDIAAAAQRKSVQRANLALNNAREIAVETGDIDGYRKNRADHKYLTPEEIEADDREITEEVNRRLREIDIQRDPAGEWEKLPKEPPSEPGDFVRWNAERDLIQSQLREKTGAAMEDAADLLAQGKLVHPDQVDSMFADLRPAARERLKEAVRNQQAAKQEALTATPGYQAGIVGKASGLIDRYNPDAVGFDEDYVEIAALVATLPESPVRTELQRNLRTAREGGMRQIETAADFHRQALDDLRKQGAFGNATATVRRPVTDFVRDGLLNDPAKLEKTGIPPETARKIAEEKDPREQVAILKKARAEADKEGGFLDTNEPFDRQVFDAILKGDGMLESADLASREKERRAAGLAKTKLEQWLNANPNATEEQGRQKLLEITGELAVPGMVEQILSAPPAWGDGSGGMVLPDKPQD